MKKKSGTKHRNVKQQYIIIPVDILRNIVLMRALEREEELDAAINAMVDYVNQHLEEIQ